MAELGIACPFCGGLLEMETYKMERGYAPKILVFCDNDVCTIKPSTVEMQPTLAFKDVEAWGSKHAET